MNQLKHEREIGAHVQFAQEKEIIEKDREIAFLREALSNLQDQNKTRPKSRNISRQVNSIFYKMVDPSLSLMCESNIKFCSTEHWTQLIWMMMTMTVMLIMMVAMMFMAMMKNPNEDNDEEKDEDGGDDGDGDK